MHWKVAIGLLVGVAAGLLANAAWPRDAQGQVDPRLRWIIENVTFPVGQVFLRLIFMVVIPLVFSALVLAVAEFGDLRRLGRVGFRTLLYTVVLSTISVIVGLTIVNSVRPGAGLSEAQRALLRERYASAEVKAVQDARAARSVRDTLLGIIPRNPLQEAVGAIDGSAPGGGMLSVMFFALMIGIAVTLLPAERTAPLLAVLQAVYDVVMIIIGLAMRLAPVAVAALVFGPVAELGGDLLRSVGLFMGSVLGGLGFQLAVIFPLFLLLVARVNPVRFFSGISEVMVTALATSSSNATLPTSLRVTETRLGVQREVARFVLTVGATGNQNGTALFEGITVLFLAQVFGVPLSIEQQLVVALLAMLGGVGTAGVPGGSLPLIVLILMTVGVPAEGIGIVVGVDRILDMCRTVVNVSGDIAIAVAVDRGAAPGGPPGAAQT